MREIDLAYRTMFAELGQRCLDAAFAGDFPSDGRFVPVRVKDRAYWYFTPPEGKRRYVGPAGDPELDRRVAEHRALRDDLRARRKLVSTLVREGGLPAAEAITGRVVEALAAAGLFRLRGVLVGTAAFQCYPGVLGVRLPGAALLTGDADFAQFHAVSAAVGDSLPPVLDVLRAVEPSFRELPHQADGRFATRFRADSGYQVEFLTPNRGSADHDGRPAPMPALGGASAEPLRFLDFLIRGPVRAVLLHRSGVPVTVPAPERFAVHKLVVATRRRGDPGGSAKRDKDLLQAAVLFAALGTVRRGWDLGEAFAEAWERGPAWRAALRQGLSALPDRHREPALAALAGGLREAGHDPAEHGFPDAPAPSP